MTVREEMVHGVLWTAVKKYSGAVMQLVITAVLARLLTPQDFGIVAMASVLLNLLTRFAGLGMGSAIICRQDLTKEELESIFSISIYIGVIIAILFFCLARPIANFYGNESLVTICGILSVNLLFTTWNTVPGTLMIKDKRFKFIARRTLTLQVISGGMAIIAAFKGLGMYALLIPPVFTGCMVLLINYWQYPMRFRWRPGIIGFRKIRLLSVYQLLTDFFYYFFRNTDKLIIGKYFGVTELGYYSKAYNLMQFPMQYSVDVIRSPLYPILASMQDNRVWMADKYNRIFGIFSIFAFPLSIFLFFASDDIVAIMYGRGWTATIPVLRILVLSIPWQTLWLLTTPFFQSTGRTDLMFVRSVIDVTLTVSGFLIAAVCFRTLEAMAWAWVITMSISSCIAFVLLNKYVLKQALHTPLKTGIKATLLTIVLYVFLRNITIFCADMLSSIMSLLLLSVLTAVVLLLFFVLTKRTHFFKFKK